MRDVSSVGSRSVNSYVCRNGKTSFRDCQQVYKKYVCRSIYCNLVALDANLSNFGDSGGPLYWGNTAYGIQHGVLTINGTARELSSEALLIDEAIPGTGPHIATN